MQRHPLTGEWVIVAPWRSQRPNAFELAATLDRATPDPDCPFCPGNEHQTPPEKLRKGSDDRWRIRVVPNRYPAVDASSQGVHEVVIESPAHGDHFESLEPGHAAEVIGVYAERLRALRSDPQLRHVCIFKNSGGESGQSIAHLHSQIVALPVIPPRAEMIARGFDSEPCLLCVSGEDERLLISRSRDYSLRVPAVPLFPYETWIVPKIHAPSIRNVDSDPDKLALLIQTALRTMGNTLGPVSFNWIFHNSPLPERAGFHWFLQIIPRLTLQGGFELGTGMQINIVDAREAAARLREGFGRDSAARR